MIIAYIKEKRTYNNFFKKIQGMEIEVFDNNYIINIFDKNKKGIQKRIINKLYKLKINAVVFSRELEGEFKDKICTILDEENIKNIKIVNGKKLMEYMEFDIAKYIVGEQKKNIKQEDIYIIFKKDNSLNLNFLIKFIENFRMTNVVTNDIERLRNIQENLLENEGILIAVSNNKKKALRRAKIILNVNLNTNELGKYNINKNALIINIREYAEYNNSSFEGKNINYFNISVPDEIEEKFDKLGSEFDLVKLYESTLISKNIKNIDKIYEAISREEIKVIGVG